MKKMVRCLTAAAALTISFSFTAMAGQWHEDMVGRWYENDDGSQPATGWQWLDGDGDGIAECYYIGLDGYVVRSNGRADGETVNEEGAWTVDGKVQTKDVALPNDSAAVAAYEAAVKKANSLDSMDTNGRMDMSMTMIGGLPGEEMTISMDMAMDFDMKLRGAVTGDMEYVMTGSMEMLGETLPYTMFYTDGYCYTDMMGMKMKQPMAYEEALEAAKEMQEMEGMSGGTAAMRNLKMQEENGETILTYDMNVAELNGLLDSMMSGQTAALADTGIGYDYNVKKANGRVVIDANGYYKNETVYMDMDMVMDDEASGETVIVNMTIDMVMDIVNPGQPVDFTLPSTEGYTEAEAIALE